MGCWDSFTLFCGKAGVVVTVASDILDKLASQAKYVMQALINAGVIKSTDESVIEAFDVLSKISGGLKISSAVADELIKYIPKNLKDIPDLNQDGDINVKDMIELLKSGQKVLDQFIKSGLIDTAQALTWSDVFTKLIKVLDASAPKETYKSLLVKATGVSAVLEPQQTAPQTRTDLLRTIATLHQEKDNAVSAYYALERTHRQTVSTLHHLTKTHEQTMAASSTRRQPAIAASQDQLRIFSQPQQLRQADYYNDGQATRRHR